MAPLLIQTLQGSKSVPRISVVLQFVYSFGGKLVLTSSMRCFPSNSRLRESSANLPWGGFYGKSAIVPLLMGKM